MMLNKITRQDIEDALDALTPAGKGATCWYKKLAETDEGTGLYFVVGWSAAGYSEDDINADGFGDNSGRCICTKIAYQHSNNAMQSDYDMDWLQPYDNETGDVYDTDTMLTNEPSQWGHVAKVSNSDAKDIWTMFGETGELDLMESKQSKEACKSSMQKKKESLKKVESVDEDVPAMLSDFQDFIHRYIRGGMKIELKLASTPGQDYVEVYYNGGSSPDFRVPVGGTANAYIIRDVYNKLMDRYF